MNASDINSSKYILEKLIDKALLDSFVWVTNRCGGRPQEPDYVAALSTKLKKIAASSCSRRKNAKLNGFPRSSHLCTESMGNMTLLDEVLSDYKYIEDLSDEAGVSVVLVESRLKEEYMG